MPLISKRHEIYVGWRAEVSLLPSVEIVEEWERIFPAQDSTRHMPEVATLLHPLSLLDSAMWVWTGVSLASSLREVLGRSKWE